jgi:CheY-like chemotaxis protein
MSKRVLVVEDQPDSRQIIRDMLAPTDYEINRTIKSKCRVQKKSPGQD